MDELRSRSLTSKFEGRSKQGEGYGLCCFAAGPPWWWGPVVDKKLQVRVVFAGLPWWWGPVVDRKLQVRVGRQPGRWAD